MSHARVRHRSATVTPANHSAPGRLASCRAPRHCRLSTPLSTAASSDFFCVPFGGRANGRVSTPPTPSEQRRRPGAESSTQRSQTASTAPTAALTGAPPPPARLDSTQRGQTCRVVSAAIGGDGAVVWGVFEYSVKGVQGPSSGVEFASVSTPVVCRHETCM